MKVHLHAMGPISAALSVLCAVITVTLINASSGPFFPRFEILVWTMIAIGYCFSFSLLLLTIAKTPRNDPSYLEHVKSRKAAAEAHDVAHREVTKGNGVPTNKCAEIMEVYEKEFAWHALWTYVAGACHVVAFILLGGTSAFALSYCVLPTSAPPFAGLTSPRSCVNLESHVNQLNSGIIPQDLANAWAEDGIQLNKPSVRTDGKDVQWRVTDESQQEFTARQCGTRWLTCPLDKYLSYVCFSAVTFFTIGYGDMRPNSFLGNIWLLVHIASILLVVMVKLPHMVHFELSRYESVRRALLNDLEAQAPPSSQVLPVGLASIRCDMRCAKGEDRGGKS